MTADEAMTGCEGRSPALYRDGRTVGRLEHDRRYKNLNPLRAVARPVAVRSAAATRVDLELSDGEHSLLDVAKRSGSSFARVLEVARVLVDARGSKPRKPEFRESSSRSPEPHGR